MHAVATYDTARTGWLESLHGIEGLLSSFVTHHVRYRQDIAGAKIYEGGTRRTKSNLSPVLMKLATGDEDSEVLG